MRRPYIAANWKMNKTIEETASFISEFIPLVRNAEGVDILIAPPFTSLSSAASMLKDSNVRLGAQNIYFEEKGAFTGEISADMLLSAGCFTVIIGHSERRQYFKDTDEIVNKKIKMALSKGLDVILCIGESLEEREAGKTFDRLESQLSGSLKDAGMDNITIAYEPIWAIGTGKTATPDQANEAHECIRRWLSSNKEGADGVRIQYGGSVTPDNISELIGKPDVDGALVGGASLKPDSFSKIVLGAAGKRS